MPIADEEFSSVCSFTVARQVLVTGEFIDVNSSGPILLDFHADGSLTETDWGRQFERPPGQLLLTTGPVVWEFDSAGNFVSFTQRGGTPKTSACSSASSIRRPPYAGVRVAGVIATHQPPQTFGAPLARSAWRAKPLAREQSPFAGVRGPRLSGSSELWSSRAS